MLLRNSSRSLFLSNQSLCMLTRQSVKSQKLHAIQVSMYFLVHLVSSINSKASSPHTNLFNSNQVFEVTKEFGVHTFCGSFGLYKVSSNLHLSTSMFIDPLMIDYCKWKVACNFTVCPFYGSVGFYLASSMFYPFQCSVIFVITNNCNTQRLDSEVDLSEFVYRLFHEDFSPLIRTDDLFTGCFMKISLHSSELMSGEKCSQNRP